MAYGNLTYSVSLPQEMINDIADKALAQAMADEHIEVNGVQVDLEKIGQATTVLEGKALTVRVPLKIDLKRNAGLFTVEGSGSILVQLKLNYDISKDLRLRCKSELVAHEWLEKPVLEIGALNIPVETLVDLVLKHYESVLTAKIDEAINEKSDLTPYVFQAIQSLEAQINSAIPLDSKVDMQLDTLSNMTPRTVGDTVRIDGSLSFGLSVQSKGKITNDQLPTVGWIAKLPAPEPVGVSISLGYSEIARQMVDRLTAVDMGGRKVKISDVDISFDQQLKVKLELEEPIKGHVQVTGRPTYDKEQQLFQVDDIDVKVKPSNFIYKMTVPLVNKFVEGKIEEFLPVALGEIIAEKLKNLPTEVVLPEGTIVPAVQTVRIEDLIFTDKEIEAYVTVAGLAVQLTLT